jgi:ABC-type lipoprotein export system ATPase subunit
MNETLLETKQVIKSYQNGGNDFLALDQVDFTLSRNDYISIIGPSGAGKSTLLHVLGGLDGPSSGEVFYRQDNIYAMTDREISAWRNQKIGFVFQFYYLLPELTVAENVAVPYLLFNRDRKTAFTKSAKLLEYLNIAEKKNSFPNELSGGQKQKVALARALINDPEIIFCDEPTGNLDSQSADLVTGLLASLHRDQNKTIIMVTHNPEVAKKALKTYQMKDGRIGLVS